MRRSIVRTRYIGSYEVYWRCEVTLNNVRSGTCGTWCVATVVRTKEVVAE